MSLTVFNFKLIVTYYINAWKKINTRVYLFTSSFNHPLTHLFTESSTCPHIHLINCTPIYSLHQLPSIFIQSHLFTRSVTHSFTCSLIWWYTCPPNNSFTQSPIHLFTQLFNHAFSHLEFSHFITESPNHFTCSITHPFNHPTYTFADQISHSLNHPSIQLFI